MKKLLSILCLLLITLLLQAQVSKTINITAGTLSSALTALEKTTITDLTITGTIDARDFKTMRDDMLVLETLDINGTLIEAYTGKNGSMGSIIYSYAANAVPENSFFNANLNIGKQSLKNVLLPYTTAEIAKKAFYKCNNLQEIELPYGLNKLGREVFKDCVSIETVTVPGSVDTLGFGLFDGCTNLSTAILEDGIRVIDYYVFNDCSALESLYISESLTSINGYAFSYTLSLDSIYIPAQVNNIEISAFYNSSCKYFISELNETYSSKQGVLFNSDMTALLKFPLSFRGHYRVPKGTFIIEKYAFGYSLIDSITIPHSVSFIDRNTFVSCSNLSYVNMKRTLPPGLGSNVFWDVSKWNCKLIVPLGSSGFYAQTDQWEDFDNITEEEGFNISTGKIIKSDTGADLDTVIVSAPNSWSVTCNEDWVSINPIFGDSGQAIVEVFADDNIYSSNREAFLTFKSILGDSLIVDIEQLHRDTIQVTAGELYSLIDFEEKQTISSLTLSGTIDARDFKTMRDSMPELVQLDLSNVDIIEYAGRNGTIQFPDTYQYLANDIPNSAFVSKSNLYSIVLPELLEKICGQAFYNCTDLKKIIIPGGVTEIESYVFKNCSNLDSIIIPSGLRTIGESAFELCQNLRSITIPSSVNIIENKTFSGCSKLDSISLPESLEHIKHYAFSYCINLKNLRIPNTVIEIWDNTFWGCNSLDSIFLPASINSIGRFAFGSCENLKNVVFEEGFKSIGQGAFSNCESLTSVQISSTSIIGNSAFENCKQLKTVLLADGITELSYKSFANCESIDSIDIPSSIESIGDNAFENCIGLRTLLIPNSVNSIGYKTFSDCAHLKSITLPSNKVNISSYAFRSCSLLDTIIVKSVVPYDLSNVNSVYGGVNKVNCKLFVPFGSFDLYNEAIQWKDFQNIIETNGFGLLSHEAFVDSDEGSIDSIFIYANVDWSITTNDSWISVSSSSGSTNDTIVITVEENPTPFKRSTQIEFSASGYDTEIVHVVQQESIYELHLNAGELSTELSDTLLNSLSRLKIVGNIDARDFKTIRDSMSILTYLDLSDAIIIGYSGTLGTEWGQNDYPENTIPQNAFRREHQIISKIILPNTLNVIAEYAFDGCYQLALMKIPSTVTSIGKYAFRNCESFKESLILPLSLVIIGKGAFYGCTNLIGKLELPSKLQLIQEDAFNSCRLIDSLIIPSSVEFIGTFAFYSCNLRSIYLKSGIPIILNNTYSHGVFAYTDYSSCNLYVPFGSKELYEVANQWRDFENIIEVPGFNLLSHKAFIEAELGSADSVIIKSDITWEAISSQSWLTVSPVYGISNDTLVFIAEANPNAFPREAIVTVSASGLEPDSVRIIQREAYYTVDISAGELSFVLNDSLKNNITRLKINGEIDARDFKTMRDSMPLTSDIDLRDATVVAYSGLHGTSYSLSSRDYYSNEIPQSAFGVKEFWLENTKLKTIILPQNIIKIDNSAFKNCVSLIDINLPAALTSIDGFAFDGCKKLDKIILPQGIDTIGYRAFSGCRRLKSVTLPNTLRKLSSCAFRNCDSLSFVHLPDSLISIEAYAFDGCSSLTTITIPNKVEVIRIGTFEECTALKSIILPNTLIKIESEAFSNCYNLDSIILPNTLRSIGVKAFYNCSSLSSFKLPDSLNTIDEKAFSRCSSLIYVKFPDSLTKIGKGAFYDCAALDSIILPATLDSMGIGVFSECSGLKSVVFSNSMTTIEKNSFQNCISLDSINLPNSIRKIDDDAFKGCSSLRSVIFPNSINKIGSNAFLDCKGLNGTITIPSSISVIEDGVFYGCCGINSLNIPNSIDTIGRSAFSNLTDLTGTLAIPSSVKFIDWFAFRGCSGLDTLLIPSSVDSISSHAFLECSNLKAIIVAKEVPIDLSNTFDIFEGVDKTTCILYVPFGSKPKYQLASTWRNFQNILEMSESITYDLAVSDTIVSDTDYSCFNAHNIITVAGDGSLVEFENGSSVNLIAEQSIQFLPGFHAHEGSYTHAYITTTGDFCDVIEPASMVYALVEKSNELPVLPKQETSLVQERQVKVYPNPNSGQFTIQLSNFESNVDVCVYNSLGAKIYELAETELNPVEVNLPEIKRGLYFIKVQEGEQQFIEKIIVQ